jgi:hypothetical protein
MNRKTRNVPTKERRQNRKQRKNTTFRKAYPATDSGELLPKAAHSYRQRRTASSKCRFHFGRAKISVPPWDDGKSPSPPILSRQNHLALTSNVLLQPWAIKNRNDVSWLEKCVITISMNLTSKLQAGATRTELRNMPFGIFQNNYLTIDVLDTPKP